MRSVGAASRPRPSAGPAASRRRAGFSLVELLVAASLTTLLVGAAWPWVWTAATAAREADARAQGATAQGFAARLLRRDLERCVRLGSPEQGVCGPTRVVLVCRDALTGADEVVTVAWDARRGVLWRKTTGAYLAEGVASCLMRYFTGEGEEILPSNGVLGLRARSAVARVRVEWREADTPAGRGARLHVVDVALPVTLPETSS